jgi:hypothetical protein
VQDEGLQTILVEFAFEELLLANGAYRNAVCDEILTYLIVSGEVLSFEK